MANKHKQRKILWHKESVLVVLATLSLLMLLYEEVLNPHTSLRTLFVWIDTLIAFVFLIDFIYLYNVSKNKNYFIKHNWYLLLTALPIITSWSSALRALRLVRFVRLLVAGEHLEQSIAQNKY